MIVILSRLQGHVWNMPNESTDPTSRISLTGAEEAAATAG